MATKKFEKWSIFTLENRDNYYKSVRRKEFVIPKAAILAGYTKEEFFNALREQIINKFNLDSRDLLERKGGLDSLLSPFQDDILWAFYNQMDYMIGNGTYRSVDTNLNVSLGGNSITASSNSLGWNWEEQTYNIFIKYKVFDEYGIGQLCWSWKYGWNDLGINRDSIANLEYVQEKVKLEETERTKQIQKEKSEREYKDMKIQNKYLNANDEIVGNINSIKLDPKQENILYANLEKGETSDDGKLIIGINGSQLPEGNITNDWDSSSKSATSSQLIQTTLFKNADPTKGFNYNLMSEQKTTFKIINDITLNDHAVWYENKWIQRNSITNKDMIEGVYNVNLDNTIFKDSHGGIIMNIDHRAKTAKINNQDILTNNISELWKKIDYIPRSRTIKSGSWLLFVRNNPLNKPFKIANGQQFDDIFNFTLIHQAPNFNETNNTAFLPQKAFSGSSNYNIWINFVANMISYNGNGNDIDIEEDSYLNIYEWQGAGVPIPVTIPMQVPFMSTMSAPIKNNYEHKLDDLKTMISNSQSRYELGQIKNHPWYLDISKNELKELIDIMYNDKWKEL